MKIILGKKVWKKSSKEFAKELGKKVRKESIKELTKKVCKKTSKELGKKVCKKRSKELGKKVCSIANRTALHVWVLETCGCTIYTSEVQAVVYENFLPHIRVHVAVCS